MKRLNKINNITSVIIKIFLFLLGLQFLFPLYWMINLSLKNSQEVYSNAFGLPHSWLFSNYSDAIKSFNFLLYFSNSLIYSIGTVIVTLLVGSMFAYCISRMKWKFRETALNYISLGIIIPVQVVIIPVFITLRTIHLYNTHLGLILVYSAFALSSLVLMMYAFFRTLPGELEEAAIIDGCSIYRTFFTIILPSVKGALSMQIVLIFMNSWNEFFMPYMLISKEAFRPLTIGLLGFFVGMGTNQWGLIAAAMVLTSLPTIIVYMFFSEQLENALTAGAILK